MEAEEKAAAAVAVVAAASEDQRAPPPLHCRRPLPWPGHGKGCHALLYITICELKTADLGPLQSIKPLVLCKPGRFFLLPGGLLGLTHRHLLTCDVVVAEKPVDFLA